MDSSLEILYWVIYPVAGESSFYVIYPALGLLKPYLVRFLPVAGLFLVYRSVACGARATVWIASSSLLVKLLPLPYKVVADIVLADKFKVLLNLYKLLSQTAIPLFIGESSLVATGCVLPVVPILKELDDSSK